MDASVEIQIQGGKSFMLDVGFADSVLEIKQKIQETQNIAIPRQTLMFHGVELADESIIYNELAQDARLTLVVEFAVPPPPAKLKIKLVASTGEKQNVEMNRSDKVEELRVKIETAGIIPKPENGYFFIHGQHEMHEEMSFDWHGVESGDTIDVYPGFLTMDDRNLSKFRVK